MKQIIVLLTFTLFLVSFKGQALEPEKIELQKTGYSYTFSFKSSLPPDSILSILFSFAHLKKYTLHASEVQLISVDKNSCIVEFLVKYLIYSSRSTFRRTRNNDSGTVTIEMLKFEQNSTLFPHLIKSTTTYRVVKKGDHTLLLYNQKSEFDKPVNWLYVKILKGKLHEFAEQIEWYINKTGE